MPTWTSRTPSTGAGTPRPVGSTDSTNPSVPAMTADSSVARSDSGVAEATSPPPRTLNRHSVGAAPGARPLALTHTRPFSSSMHTPVVAARRMRSAKVSSWISAANGTVTLRIAPRGRTGYGSRSM